MRSGSSFARLLCLCAATALPTSALLSAFSCAAPTPAAAGTRTAAPILPRPLPPSGRLDVLVVRGGFAGGGATASWIDDTLLDPDRPGSLSHFYDTMSEGRLRVRGTVLPVAITAPLPAANYLATGDGQLGRFDEFARHILEQVDERLDLSLFDNDGPDGLPASGDDDGYVDYVFLVLPRIPRGFLVGGATGFAGLRLTPEYVTSDAGAGGVAVRVSGSRYRGAIVGQDGFAGTVGAMAHELGHSLGLPDLYDGTYDGPADDSAGIGRWGLMGWGASGWHGDDGPNPFSAYSLEHLGWAGAGPDRMVEIDTDHAGLSLTDVRDGGAVARIPLRASFLAPGAVYAQEYLLLEHRRRGAHYDRNMPGEGLLVWHVRPQNGGNRDEAHKLVDLVCADASGNGRVDDLDHWAHEAAYARQHGGNDGDATDPFAGVRFARLEIAASPSAACSPLRLDIRPWTGGTALDVRIPCWSGVLHGDVHWLGQVTVDGDLTIAPDACLTIYPDTRVRVAADRTRGGIDPQRTEILVQGQLVVSAARLTRWERRAPASMPTGPVLFHSDEVGATWFGMRADALSSLEVPEGALLLGDALYSDIVPVADVGVGAATAVGWDDAAPVDFGLFPNSPNPFNAVTAIGYELPAAQRLRLLVFDALGRRVRLLVDGARSAGQHEVIWDGRDDLGEPVASGVYICRVRTAAGGRLSRQMVLAK